MGGALMKDFNGFSRVCLGFSAIFGGFSRVSSLLACKLRVIFSIALALLCGLRFGSFQF